MDSRNYRDTRQYWHHTHTHTHTRLTALCPGLPGWAGTRKVKPIWILLKRETVSGSGISWDTCKSAPHSRQITIPALQHSVFYRPDALPAAQPTVSKHWRQKHWRQMNNICGGGDAGCRHGTAATCCHYYTTAYVNRTAFVRHSTKYCSVVWTKTRVSVKVQLRVWSPSLVQRHLFVISHAASQQRWRVYVTLNCITYLDNTVQ